MSRPQVINVPPYAGIGTVPPVQVPLINNQTVTLINQNNYLGLTLCNTSDFNPGTTWPLPPSTSAAQPGINNLWVQNPNNVEIEVLVLEGAMPINLVSSNGYLPTSTPMVFAGKVPLTSTNINVNYTIPPGAKGIAFTSIEGLYGFPFVTISGKDSGAVYLSLGFYSTTWGSCQIAPELDTNILINISMSAATPSDTMIFFWLFTIDDTGQWTIPGYDGLPYPSVNYGKNTVITNNVVPVTFRDRYNFYYIDSKTVTTAEKVNLTTNAVNMNYYAIWRIVISLQGTGTIEAQVAFNGNVISDLVCTNAGSLNDNLEGFLIQNVSPVQYITLQTFGTITSCTATIYYTYQPTL